MKKEKWIIPVVVIVSAVLLVFAVVGAPAIYNYYFPMADSIVCPNEEDVASISLMKNSDPATVIELADFGYILHSIRNAQPTRNWSVNDYPTAEDYYTIEINTSQRQYRYFVYIEDSQVYLERPYKGVYTADQQIFDFLEAAFAD